MECRRMEVLGKQETWERIEERRSLKRKMSKARTRLQRKEASRMYK